MQHTLPGAELCLSCFGLTVSEDSNAGTQVAFFSNRNTWTRFRFQKQHNGKERGVTSASHTVPSLIWTPLPKSNGHQQPSYCFSVFKSKDFQTFLTTTHCK